MQNLLLSGSIQDWLHYLKAAELYQCALSGEGMKIGIDA